MKKTNVFFVALVLFAGCAASYADSVPFGVLSAYHLVAFGTTGDNSIAGNMIGPITSESVGRIAAADQITHVTLSGDAQMGGNFIVAAAGPRGVVYDDEFVDALTQFVFRDDEPTPATTPEPRTLALMGSGILFMAGLVHMQKRV